MGHPQIVCWGDESLLDGLGFLGHQFGEARVGAEAGELGVGIDLVDVFVALLHRLAQVFEGMIEIAGLGIHLGDHEGKRGAIFGRRRPGHDSGLRHALKDVRVKLVGGMVLLRRFVELVLGEVARAQVVVKGRRIRAYG